MLDVLVAGGGPAGSTAALLLARAGRPVRVYERSTFPRTKACGEYLSAGAVRLLHALGVAAPLAAHARPVNGVRLHGHGVHAQIAFPQPGWSVPRSVLDDVLLNAAVQAGATVERARVEDCTDSPEFATLTLRRPDGTLEVRHARAVVGADGIHSVVARKSGLSNARRMPARFALGGHYRGVRSTGEYIDMFVDGRTYVAINPLAGDAANVMLVVEQSELERHCDDVEGFAEARARALAGDVLAGAQLEHKRIAIGPLAHRAQRLAAKHIVLVGDAARFVDPFTGQGVYLAMRCAQIAAECILAGTPHRYAHRAAREIAGRERAARIVSRVIGSARIARAAAALFRLHPHAVSPLVRRVTGAA